MTVSSQRKGRGGDGQFAEGKAGGVGGAGGGALILETEFQGKFGQWVKEGGGAWMAERYRGEGLGIELKVARRGKLYFRQIEEHQIEALARCGRARRVFEGEGVAEYPVNQSRAFKSVVYHKLSDMSADQKPFDCFVIYGGVGLLAVIWEHGGRGGGGGDGGVEGGRAGGKWGAGFWLFEIETLMITKNRKGGMSVRSFAESDAVEYGGEFIRWSGGGRGG